MIKSQGLDGLAEYIESYGDAIISDSNLPELLLPQVPLLSNKRRDFCLFESCILEISLQDSLNSWRLIHIIHIQNLAEYRGATRSYGVIQ